MQERLSSIHTGEGACRLANKNQSPCLHNVWKTLNKVTVGSICKDRQSTSKHGLKLNEHSGDADLSKDISGPESPPELRRSWGTHWDRYAIGNWPKGGVLGPRDVGCGGSRAGRVWGDGLGRRGEDGRGRIGRVGGGEWNRRDGGGEIGESRREGDPGGVGGWEGWEKEVGGAGSGCWT
ncbi:hypothetical protein Tco_0688537 [Tanacetum coccineum]